MTFSQRFLQLIAVLLFVSLLGATSTFGAEDKKTSTTLDEKRRFQITTTQTDESDGVQKWIMTLHTEGQKYHILDSTVINGLLGEALSMDELAVPCDAEVTYNQLNKGDRNALSIKVKKYLPGASTNWPTALPE